MEPETPSRQGRRNEIAAWCLIGFRHGHLEHIQGLAGTMNVQ